VDGARAVRKLIIIAEEIVEPGVISSDPNRTLVPGFLVTAVVHEPWGAHPSPVQGYYGRDHEFFAQYHDQSRRLEDFEQWLTQWILQAPDRRTYVNLLGAPRTEALSVNEHAFSAAADFGY
jgi:glutaconate CoA-transferase subunit A